MIAYPQKAFVGRDTEWMLLQVGYVAGTNLLFLSEPGTAKTMLIEKFSIATGQTFFESQLSVFSVMEDLFGPINTKTLMDTGAQVRILDNAMVMYRVVFLDEIFKTTGALHGALLTFLASRDYMNPDKKRALTHFVVAASNEIPDSDFGGTVDAFVDRFLLRHWMAPVGPGNMEKLFAIGYAQRKNKGKVLMPRVDIEDEAARVWDVKVPDAINAKIAKIFCEVQKKGISISDRSVTRLPSLVQAHAILNGRMEASEEDLDILRYTMWRKQADEITVASIVRNIASPEMAAAESMLSEIGSRMEEAFHMPDGLARAKKYEGIREMIDKCRATVEAQPIPAERKARYIASFVDARDKLSSYLLGNLEK